MAVEPPELVVKWSTTVKGSLEHFFRDQREKGSLEGKDEDLDGETWMRSIFAWVLKCVSVC